MQSANVVLPHIHASVQIWHCHTFLVNVHVWPHTSGKREWHTVLRTYTHAHTHTHTHTRTHAHTHTHTHTQPADEDNPNFSMSSFVIGFADDETLPC